jgi:glycosyltransferase involved in cell wall biosynthesis
MRVAVNTRFLLPDNMEGYGYFIAETLKRITQKHPEHQFIFLFDRPFDKKFLFSDNITAVIISPPARHPLLWKYWYDIKVTAALKKHKADVFVSPDGFCSLTTSVPQCVAVHDLSFLQFPSYIKKSHLLFYKRYTPKFLTRAKSIATVSDFTKQDIIKQYKTPGEKINVIYSAAKEIFKPASEAVKEEVKNKYSQGKEYFIYIGAIHPRKNLLNILKSFSVFKKRQQSNFKLIIAGRLAWKNDKLIESLKTYKYKEDVIMPGYVEETELVNLLASSYCLVYPSLYEGFGVPPLEAMQCNVPVITSQNSSMQEICGDAALYADPQNHTDIADKMMQVYKDETLRNGLIEKGTEVSKLYSWDRTAELLWQTIVKTVN